MRSAHKILSLFGFSSCLVGAFWLFIASLPAIAQELHADVPDHSSAVYVGAASCYTCHDDLEFEWSRPLHPRVIDNLVLNPQPDIVGTNSALPVGSNVDSMALRRLGYAASDAADAWLDDTFSQSFTLAVSKEETLP